IPRKHFESAHGAECPVDEKGNIVGVDDAGIASFDNDGRFAARSGSIVEVASGVQVGGTVAPYDDVVEPKGEHHFLGCPVLGFFASRSPIRVRTEALVEVAAVIVDQVVTSVDNLLGDQKRRTVGLCPIFLPRIEAIHALVIDRINVWDLLFEGLNVDKGDENY